MDMLRDGLLWLGQQQRDYASSPAVFHHGADSFNIMAVYSAQVIEDMDDTGVPFTVNVHDFIFNINDIDNIEPKESDQIVAFGIIYEVRQFGFDGAFRYTSPDRQTVRVHTQIIDKSEENQQIEEE